MTDLNIEGEIDELLYDFCRKINQDKPLEMDKFKQALIELVARARSRTLTDITVWANNEMAKDHVALSSNKQGGSNG